MRLRDAGGYLLLEAFLGHPPPHLFGKVGSADHNKAMDIAQSTPEVVHSYVDVLARAEIDLEGVLVRRSRILPTVSHSARYATLRGKAVLNWPGVTQKIHHSEKK